MSDRLEEIKERYRYTTAGTDDGLMYPVDAQDAMKMAADFDWLISEVERLKSDNIHLKDDLNGYEALIDTLDMIDPRTLEKAIDIREESEHGD